MRELEVEVKVNAERFLISKLGQNVKGDLNHKNCDRMQALDRRVLTSYYLNPSLGRRNFNS